MQLSKKQNEYIVNATHRWNIKSGAVRSGKSYVDTAFVVPFRIRERTGKSGLNVILGVSKESIERNVLQPMREIYTELICSRLIICTGGSSGACLTGCRMIPRLNNGLCIVRLILEQSEIRTNVNGSRRSRELLR